MTEVDFDAWEQRPSWLPGAGVLGRLLGVIQKRTGTVVSSFFSVNQGIRTGANEVFLQPAEVVENLPAGEQRYFQRAVDTESFIEGEIRSRHYLFVPNQAWDTEQDVAASIPVFFNRFLRTRKEDLAARKFLVENRWWDLARKRSWAFGGPPRLVSKRFGLYPAFARDLKAEFAIVQANAWTPTEALTGRDGESVRETITAYWWFLNSRVAVALFREYCPNVAGGQLDLEKKYVKHVPLPDLGRQLQESPALQVLAASIRTSSKGKLPSLADRDDFSAAAFGTDLSDWNLSGLR